MRFSLRLNNDLEIDQYRALARAADQLGFDQLWVSHDLFLHSAPVLLAAIAEVTEQIEIGPGILNPYTQSPAEIAMTIATLDQLSGGRCNLGLAAGAGDFLGWVGLDQPRPLAAVRESTRAIRLLLEGERAEIDGRFLHWGREAYLRLPTGRVPPIYLGATGPRMLELAGEIGDGVLPLLFPPEHYATVRPMIERGVAKRSRRLGELDLAACVWVSIDEDRDAARRALAEKIVYYGPALSPLLLHQLGLERGDFAQIEAAWVEERDLDRACSLVDERMMAIGVVGTAEEVVQRLEPLVEAGVGHLSFGPPLGPDPLVAVELLGKKVLPYFERRRFRSRHS